MSNRSPLPPGSKRADRTVEAFLQMLFTHFGITEQACAEMEDRWLLTADDPLVDHAA